MSGVRDYTVGTRTALAALSRGTCYWPTCATPIVTAVNGKYKMNLQIAHIRALAPNGPRHAANMSTNQLNSFDNLILLCKPHHDEVDRDAPGSYPVSLLRQWKTDREQSNGEALAALQGVVTETALQEAISKAVQQRDEEIKETLARLENNEADAAALLREMRSELADAGITNQLVNSEMVELLSVAAQQLKNLPDAAEQLSAAAQNLQHLEATSIRLSNTSESLAHLDSLVDQLHSASRAISGTVEDTHRFM